MLLHWFYQRPKVEEIWSKFRIKQILFRKEVKLEQIYIIWPMHVNIDGIRNNELHSTLSFHPRFV
jgi:hypothetical protein